MITVSTLASPMQSTNLVVLPSDFGHFDDYGKSKGEKNYRNNLTHTPINTYL